MKNCIIKLRFLLYLFKDVTNENVVIIVHTICFTINLFYYILNL